MHPASAQEFLPLLNYVKSMLPSATSDELSQLQKIAEFAEVPSGWFLIQEGQYCKKVGFICSGLFKTYSLTEDGRLFIRDFSTNNDFISDYLATRNRVPATSTIEAMEPSKIVLFDADVLLPFLASTPNTTLITRLLLETLCERLAAREMQLLSLDAKKRYESYIHRFTKLAHRIPKQDVAAFIGITPVSLSRILKDF